MQGVSGLFPTSLGNCKTSAFPQMLGTGQHEALKPTCAMPGFHAGGDPKLPGAGQG